MTAGPLDRVPDFLDVLLARAALVMEGDDALSRPRQVGHDEAETRVQLAWIPLDLGHDAAWLAPTLRLIAEASVGSREPHATVARPGASAGSRSCAARRYWPAAGSGSRRGEPPEKRLAQQAGQPMTTILASPFRSPDPDQDAFQYYALPLMAI